eukprot:CAMPEP_0115657170 /NCGR_PEP_ID=MMETSP0272-20121206/44544_1 /TAXON_ID=71861 /ORGANISM="Scrippsiella trochoidea, Strain CCMP3099" /LENGTH=376 /DNA_ID=CAMNT_0003095193 /DNA_START=61 /DNA_END=1187 /DNA_ORIENTATION=-
MAPSALVAARAGSQPQNPPAGDARGGIADDIETAVWSWQAPAASGAAALQPAVAAAAAPPPAPAATKRKPNVVVLAAALMAGLLALLVGGFVLALHTGSRHSAPAAPAATLTHTGASHKDLPVAGDNATSAPMESSTTTTTASVATTSTAAPAATVASSSSSESSTASLPPAVTAVTTTTMATAAAASTSSGSTSAGASSTSLRGAVKCYNFYSQMNTNPLQKYPSNPDSEAFGFTTCMLCTDGASRCTSLLHGGRSDLIASHIHLAEGPDADGTRSEGPPVINFCGSNAQGLIQDGMDYSAPCVQWTDGAAHNKDMEGVLVPNFNRGLTAAQRVEDIVKRPHMYYFNFHTLASWNHWYPKPHGMSRGVLVFQGEA